MSRRAERKDRSFQVRETGEHRKPDEEAIVKERPFVVEQAGRAVTRLVTFRDLVGARRADEIREANRKAWEASAAEVAAGPAALPAATDASVNGEAVDL